MAINELDAREVFDRFETLDAATKPRAAKMLADYRTQQDAAGAPVWPTEARRLNEQRQQMRAVFDDPRKLDESNGLFGQISDPATADKLRVKEASTLFLADRYGKPVEEVRGDFARYSLDYSSQQWGEKKVMEPAAFFAKAKGEIETQKTKLQTLTSAADAALVSALRGGSDVADFSAWQVENEHTPEAFNEARKVWKNTRDSITAKLGADGMAFAKRGVRALQTSTGTSQQSDAWMNEARRDLIAIKASNPKKYELVLAAMKLMGGDGKKDAKGIMQGIGENFGRSVENIAAGAVEASQIGSARLAEMGVTNADNPDALAKSIRAGIDVDGDLRDLAAGVIDPVQSTRTGILRDLEQGVYVAAGSAPYMLAVMAPGGQAAVAGSFTADAYRDFRQAGWNGADAETAALASGVFQAAVEKASEAIIKIPGAAGVLAKYGVKPGSSWATQFLMRSGLRAGVEVGEEVIQEATTPFLQELAATISPSIPNTPEGQHLSDVMGKFFERENFAPLLISVLPLGMIGAGISSTRDMGQMNDAVRLLGEAEAVKIMAESDPAKRDVMIREAWKKTETDKLVTRANEIYETEVKSFKEAGEALRKAETMQMIPFVRRDAQGWQVEDKETGDLVRVGTREEAVELAYSSLDENARQEAESLAQVLEAYSSGGDVLEIDFGKEELITEEGISEDEMREAAIVEAQLNGMSKEDAEKVTWAVLGSNRLETVEGVRRAVSSLFGGASVMDAIEEPVEAKWQAGLEQGIFTNDEGLSFVRMVSEVMQAPELLTAAMSSPRGMTEAISDIVMADTFGKRKDGSKGVAGAVTAGLKAKLRGEAGADQKAATKFAAFLAAFRRFFKQVFQRSRALLKARKEGTLSGDFDEFLDTLMKVDPQQRHEAAAAKEALEIAEAGNMAFSLAPLASFTTKAEREYAFGDGRYTHPVTLANGSRLSGETFDYKWGSKIEVGKAGGIPTFFGYTKNGDEFTIQARDVRPEMLVKSGDGNRTANDLRDRLAMWHEKAKEQGFDYLSRPSFSLAPRSLASVADTVLASQMRKPEFREAFAKAARERLDKLRTDGEWRVSKNGVASKRIGFDTQAANDRAGKNIEAERKFRLRSRQRELIDAGLAQLTPATLAAYDQGMMSLEDQPLIREMLSENGKLMSKTTAQKSGKLKTDGKGNAGDYDGVPRLPIGWYSKGSGIMPDVMAQNLADAGLINDASVDALWDALRSAIYSTKTANESFKKARDAVRKVETDALAQAKEESDTWAKNEKAKVPTPKERQMMALRTLDAILSAYPPEIRGMVGGFVKLASLGTDKAREAEIIRRLDKLDEIVEKMAKKHYGEKIEKILDKAAPKRDAGKKPTGKLGPQIQALFDLAETFSELDEAGVSAERAAIAERMEKETKPAKLADLLEREQMLDLFGAVYERTSAEMESAAKWLDETYTQGRNVWRAVIEARQEETKAGRAEAKADTGKEGLDSEQQAAIEQAKTITGKTKAFGLSFLSFEQVMHSALGRTSALAKSFVNLARKATNQKTDALRDKRKAFRAEMAAIFGTSKQTVWQQRLFELSQISDKSAMTITKMEGANIETVEVPAEIIERILNGKAEAKAYKLDTLTLEALADAWADNEALPGNRREKNLSYEVTTAGKPTPTKLSQLQAVHLSMMARQASYAENMAGHGWDADALQEIEAQLTPEAKAIRDFLATEYRTGYDSLNAVYSRMYGLNLPRLTNYAPGTFEAMDAMGQDIDPYGQGLLSEGGFKAGMLKTRKKHNAKPRLEDALSVYWGHVNATEHFKAFGEFARDIRGVLNHSDVRGSITAKGGKTLLESVQNWITAFERNGVESRGTSSAFNEFIRRRQSSQAYLALAYNVGTLLKQSTAALGSLMNMGPIDGARQFAKLLSGQLELGASYRSDVIQRRLDAGYSPEVRQAMAGMMAEKPTWGTPIVQRGMEIIGMVDAMFTTASHAMAYDYHLRQAKAAGLNDTQAGIFATHEAEASVTRTAQPSEMMDRSLVELGMSPMAKFLFMFATEARQKAAIAWDAYAPSSGLSKGERASRLIMLHIVLPLIVQTITSAWRDARDDGEDDEVFDEKNWQAGDYAKAMILGPLLGIPVIGGGLNAAMTGLFGGHYFANDPNQPLNQAAGGAADIWEGITEGDLDSGLKGAKALIKAGALAAGGEKAAAVGAGANVLSDAYRVIGNLATE